jgi:metallo-beta-lactamase family protein
MCTAGRIKHHLKKNIVDSNSTILFVGFQGQGTLGRVILDGKDEVRIHGRLHPVRAHIEQIHGFSGHADRDALLRWAGFIQSPPQRVFLTHGEEDSSLSLAEKLRQQQWTVDVPEYLDTVELP